MKFLNLINAFSWVAADLQILLMCRLKFGLSSNCGPKSFNFNLIYNFNYLIISYNTLINLITFSFI